MSANPTPNPSTDVKSEKPATSSYNVPKEGWSWIPMLLAVAVLLPTGMWIWPKIPADWILDNEWLIMVAIGVSAIALGIKLNTWIKNKNEGAVDSNSMGGVGGGVAHSSQTTSTIPEIKTIQNKPLAKSHNMSYGAGKGLAKEVGQYRHEDKMAEGEADKMTLKGWGGSEGGGGSVDASGRGAQKKPVRR